MADFNFRFDDDWYTAQGAKSMYREHKKEMREEYSRMRSAAEKRLKRLKESDFRDSKTLKRHKNGFAKLDDIDPRDFHKAFKDVAGFLRSKRGSATGQREIRKKTIESLNTAIGSDKVNVRNYNRVIKVLDELRERKIKSLYGSETIADQVNLTMALSNEQFDVLIDHLEKFLDMGIDFAVELENYREDNELDSYSEIDMNDFANKVGW